MYSSTLVRDYIESATEREERFNEYALDLELFIRDLEFNFG